MNRSTLFGWALGLALALCGCGGGGGDTAPSTSTPSPAAGIGAAGGTVAAPGGAQVVVPAGALAKDTPIAVEQTTTGAPPLPADTATYGPMFAFTPHGTAFAAPVTITVPFDPALLPAGAKPALYKTTAGQAGWEDVAGATVSGNTMTAAVTSFSHAVVGSEPLKPLTRGAPVRDFEVYDFDPQVIDPPRDRAVGLVGGVLKRDYDFGPASFFDPGAPPDALLPRELRASGHIFGSAGGGIYSVSAEAPSRSGGALAPFGSLTWMEQRQGFTKNAADAKLRLKFTQIRIEALDTGAADLAVCNAAPGAAEAADCDGDMHAHIQIIVDAFTATRPLMTARTSTAELQGRRQHWTPSFAVAGLPPIVLPLFDATKFQFDDDVAADGSGNHARLTLKEPLVVDIDLSSVDVLGRFTVEATVLVFVHNRRLGETYLGAFVRDPVDSSGTVELGGAQILTSGVEPNDAPEPPPPVTEPPPPAGCAPGPEAGTLQWLSPSERIPEAAGAGAQLFLTRSGGRSGRVSITVTPRDGSAVAGVDHAAAATTVTFEDGDIAPRLVPVPLIYDPAAEGDKSFDLVLSNPTGCARLGTATTTVTIVDDTRPLPAGAFKLGGTVSGLAGSGLVLSDLGEDLPVAANGPFAFVQPLANGLPYTVSVKTQPTGPAQVCTVTRGSGTIAGADVNDVAVDCVTPPPTGGLDPAFGSGGKVFSTLLALPDSAAALAVQADGRIVVVGSRFGSGGTRDFALARFNADGSADTSFGIAGLVTAGFATGSDDEARAVAVQPDGRIVVAGRSAPGTSSIGRDFALARFNADGTLDTGFGSGGFVRTDFGASRDEAQAVLVQPDGRIVVAGNAFTTTDVFGLVRYNANGSLDTTFGSGGKVTTELNGGQAFARGLVLQADGRIVAVGGATLAGSSSVDQTGVVRYNADGSLDPTFGSGGKVVRPVAGGFEAAVQAGGKLLVAGFVNSGAHPHDFALLRLNADGSVDTGFGSGGVLTTDIGSRDDFGRALQLQADGRIVLAGDSTDITVPGGAGREFALARFNADGTPDPSFGSGGQLRIDFFGGDDLAFGLALQPDGRLVVAGSAASGSTRGIGLARLNP